MRPARHIILLFLFTLSDLMIFNVSLFSTLLIVLSKDQQHGISATYNIITNLQTPQIVFLLCINLSLLFISSIKKSNQSHHSHSSANLQDCKSVVKIVAFCLLIMLVLSYSLNIQLITLTFINYFVIIFTASLYLMHVIRRTSLNFLRSLGYNNRTIVVVGINDRALKFIDYLEKHKSLGFKILGFIDDQQQKSKYEYPILCNLTELQNYIRNISIDEIAIFLPVRSHYNIIQKIINTCQEHGIVVRYSSNVFNIAFSFPTKFSSVQADNVFLITMITGKINGWSTLAKRLFDATVSIILLIILSPLFLIVSIIIKFTSSGPIFFVQKRIGLNKRKFDLYKFRTMVVDAEQQLDKLEAKNEVAGPVFKIKKDPRILPFGLFLRKSSIDELPQLFNVLIGDVSLVGPRPLPVRDFEGFYKDWHRRRFSVKPGITCTWQIKGRHDISFEEWMKLDLKYIDEWSLWLDCKILLGTIPAVLNFSKAS